MLSETQVPRAPELGGPYSTALALNELVVVSAQRLVSATASQCPATFEKQATLGLENVMRVLSAAGSVPASSGR
jgi:enamine deaminase RidA (YjgF/YER057c/UK114 family)